MRIQIEVGWRFCETWHFTDDKTQRDWLYDAVSDKWLVLFDAHRQGEMATMNDSFVIAIQIYRLHSLSCTGFYTLLNHLRQAEKIKFWMWWQYKCSLLQNNGREARLTGCMLKGSLCDQCRLIYKLITLILLLLF